MSMSKKDYEIIARIIQDADLLVTAKLRLAVQFADELAREYSGGYSFDKARFIRACQPAWTVGTRSANIWDRAVWHAEKERETNADVS